jgi:8-oxo-dGTP pyrophosphatase MutT (NUDIX family)
MNSGMSSQGRGRRQSAASEAQRLTQYAALAWRRPGGGPVEILLITSRETRRWVIPKGWPIKGLKPHQAAAREAWEEAGVEGRASARKIGSFDYDKRLSGGQLQPVRVEVYPLQVLQEHDDWPEAQQRERRWTPAAEAGSLVDEPGLAQLLSTFPGRGA